MLRCPILSFAAALLALLVLLGDPAWASPIAAHLPEPAQQGDEIALAKRGIETPCVVTSSIQLTLTPCPGKTILTTVPTTDH